MSDQHQLQTNVNNQILLNNPSQYAQFAMANIMATLNQIQLIYNKFLNRQVPQDILEKIPENTFISAEIIFRIKDFIFNSNASCEDILSPFFQF